MQYLKLNIILTTFLLVNAAYSQSWVQQSSGTTSSLKSISFLTEQTVLVCGFNGTLLKTTNGGLNWFPKISGTNDALFTMKFFNSLTGYAIGRENYGGVIYKTTDSGENWTRTLVVMDSLQGFFRCHFYSETLWYSIAFVDVPFFGTATALYMTTNSGNNWSRTGFAVPDEYISEVYFVNELTGHFVTRRNSTPSFGYDYKTTTGGGSWTYKALGANSYSVYFRDINTGFAGGDGGFIWKTTNGGNNWLNAQCCPGGLQGAFSFPSENTGYSAGYAKIYKTVNGGNNWFNISASFITVVYYDIKFFNDTIGYCVGDAGTILKTTNGGITALNNSSGTVPAEYSLSQNYPNPFNPATVISFDIPKSSLVSLIVYDAMGREVKTLLNESLGAGAYSFDWDASSYPTGVYFYKLQANEFISTRKMVLIK